MVFFHPCWDVRQAAWDPCSYRWIIWSKWEIELCVISIEVVGEAMCLYDGSQWCSVCGEEEGSKNRSLGNPSDQFMCFGYLPSPGQLATYSNRDNWSLANLVLQRICVFDSNVWIKLSKITVRSRVPRKGQMHRYSKPRSAMQRLAGGKTATWWHHIIKKRHLTKNLTHFWIFIKKQPSEQNYINVYRYK